MKRQLLIALLVWTLTAGCAAPQPAGSPASAPGHETSVAPGINEPYQAPDVDRFVARFETESREVFAQRRQIVADMRLRPGSAVADIGAGTGAFTFALADAVGPHGRVYAVDIAAPFLEHIRSRAAERGVENVTTVRCPEDSVALPPQSIDAAFVCDTYHHFEYPQSSLASIREALRPGGELFIVDFERVEGQSSDWVLKHVRCGKDTVVQEVTSAGFELLPLASRTADLKENYFLRFRKR